MTFDEAIQQASLAWCTPETSTIEMDSRLGEAFANILLAKHEDAKAASEAAYTQGHLDAVNHYGEIGEYVLVPIEPTEEMEKAGWAWVESESGEWNMKDAYKAMIEAAQGKSDGQR